MILLIRDVGARGRLFFASLRARTTLLGRFSVFRASRQTRPSRAGKRHRGTAKGLGSLRRCRRKARAFLPEARSAYREPCGSAPAAGASLPSCAATLRRSPRQRSLVTYTGAPEGLDHGAPPSVCAGPPSASPLALLSTLGSTTTTSSLNLDVGVAQGSERSNH